MACDSVYGEQAISLMLEPNIKASVVNLLPV